MGPMDCLVEQLYARWSKLYPCIVFAHINKQDKKPTKNK